MRAVTASRYRTQYPCIEISTVTALDRVVHADTSKNEATWYGVLRHYDARFDTALRVFEGQ